MTILGLIAYSVSSPRSPGLDWAAGCKCMCTSHSSSMRPSSKRGDHPICCSWPTGPSPSKMRTKWNRNEHWETTMSHANAIFSQWVDPVCSVSKVVVGDPEKSVIWRTPIGWTVIHTCDVICMWSRKNMNLIGMQKIDSMLSTNFSNKYSWICNNYE